MNRVVAVNWTSDDDATHNIMVNLIVFIFKANLQFYNLFVTLYTEVNADP